MAKDGALVGVGLRRWRPARQGLAAFASSGIPPVDPDPAAHYAYMRGVWPELFVPTVVLLVAFMALIGRAGREDEEPPPPDPEALEFALLGLSPPRPARVAAGDACGQRALGPSVLAAG
jgi:hypothetical protein